MAPSRSVQWAWCALLNFDIKKTYQSCIANAMRTECQNSGFGTHRVMEDGHLYLYLYLYLYEERTGSWKMVT